MAMVVQSVLSAFRMLLLIIRFCAVNLGSSIEKAINTSPYKDATSKRPRSDSRRKGDWKSTSGFLREMDIVNGFQLCDAKYKGTATRGILASCPFSVDDGSTVVSAFVNKTKNQLITAHVGDSRAVMVTDDSSFDLTIDHKPSNPSEKERVELQGGEIIQYGVLRVQGILAVTRSLGDFSLRPYVSNVPTVSYYEMKGDECFLVLASDGLWYACMCMMMDRDVLDHQDVTRLLEYCIHDVQFGGRDDA